MQHTHVCTCMCVCVFMCAYVYVCTHTYAHTNVNSLYKRLPFTTELCTDVRNVTYRTHTRYTQQLCNLLCRVPSFYRQRQFGEFSNARDQSFSKRSWSTYYTRLHCLPPLFVGGCRGKSSPPATQWHFAWEIEGWGEPNLRLFACYLFTFKLTTSRSIIEDLPTPQSPSITILAFVKPLGGSVFMLQ